MTNRMPCRRAAGLVLSALVFFTLSNVQAAIPPAEKLLPENTLMVFTIPNFSMLRADANQSPL